jgi:hypothetical protein
MVQFNDIEVLRAIFFTDRYLRKAAKKAFNLTHPNLWRSFLILERGAGVLPL